MQILLAVSIAMTRAMLKAQGSCRRGVKGIRPTCAVSLFQHPDRNLKLYLWAHQCLGRESYAFRLNAASWAASILPETLSPKLLPPYFEGCCYNCRGLQGQTHGEEHPSQASWRFLSHPCSPGLIPRAKSWELIPDLILI